MKDGPPPTPGTHPIRVVSLRTGLSPDILRVWEKRYGAVSPSRTPTGRRAYSDQDLERLRLLRQATLGGRRIGDVANLSTEALQRLVKGDAAELARTPSPPSATAETTFGSAVDWLESCLGAVRALDTVRLDAILRRALLVLGVPGFIETLVVPLVHKIGGLWEDGSLDPYEEHFATVIVRRVLEGAIRDTADDASRPSLLVATPARQRHEIGALLAAAYATAHGWRAVYLGPDLPASDIAHAARTRGVRAVALSIVYPVIDPALAEDLRALRKLLPGTVTILAGGAGAVSFRRVLDGIGATTAVDLHELGAALRELERNSTPTAGAD